MSAVQIFCGDRMAVVAHLVGVDQLGYEKELGMTPSVMKNDKSWRGMLLKDNDGDWGVAVAAWRGMKKGQPGVPGENFSSMIILYIRNTEALPNLKYEVNVVRLNEMNESSDRKSFN